MERVTAVIVTFNNALMLRHLLADLRMQTRPPNETLVVDNASFDNTELVVKSCRPPVIYVRLLENEGSAGGYHEGIRTAMRTADLIWTLDDDVRLDSRSLEFLLRGFRGLQNSRRVGAVRCVGEHHASVVPTALEFVPWRGTLFPVEAIRAAGLPKKEYFLYGEDLEYSIRLRKLAYTFYWIPGSRCIERRKGKADFELLNRPGEVYTTPFRLYYAFRNEVSAFLEHRYFVRLVRTLMYAIKVVLYFVLRERSASRDKITAIAQGVRDGLSYRLGRNPAYVPSVGPGLHSAEHSAQIGS